MAQSWKDPVRSPSPASCQHKDTSAPPDRPLLEHFQGRGLAPFHTICSIKSNGFSTKFFSNLGPNLLPQRTHHDFVF